MRHFAFVALTVAALASTPAEAQGEAQAERDVSTIQECLTNTPQEMCAGVVLNPCAQQEAEINYSASARVQRYCYMREAAAWQIVIRAHAEQYRAMAPAAVASQISAYLESTESNDDARCTIENVEYEELSGLGEGECLIEILPARDAWLRTLISHHSSLYPQ